MRNTKVSFQCALVRNDHAAMNPQLLLPTEPSVLRAAGRDNESCWTIPDPQPMGTIYPDIQEQNPPRYVVGMAL